MNYISTRGNIKPILFSDTVLMGLASDGGLILPASIPDMRPALKELAALDYRELCVKLMLPFVDFPEDELRALISKSYASFRSPDVVEIKSVGNFHILELFHGPTLAFKDLALQFLGNLFEKVLSERGGELNILAATSGDTGSAAIHGVRNRDGIRIFVMHPSKRVSRVQELQMTSVLDDNIFNIAVNGTFDDCQSVMKQVFSDLDYKAQYSLGSVNSINWARILAQVVYYFYSAFKVMSQTGSPKVSFCVPTGNFGDIFAGYLAWRMGLPIEKLILATNHNDILARFFIEGDYSCGEVLPSLSPSMDIQVASNFERYLFYRCGCDQVRLRAIMAEFSATGNIDAKSLDPDDEGVFAAGMMDDSDTLKVIARVWKEHGYLLDPHTAVGWGVAEQIDSGAPVICLATAHPAKFPDAVKVAIGEDIACHPVIDALEGMETRCSHLEPAADKVKSFISTAVGE